MNLLNPFPLSANERFASNSPLICFSHLRWDFVLQRPQHLMQRFSKLRQVFFFEEFIPTDHHLAYLEIHPFEGTSVKAVRPRIPHWWSETDREIALGKLLEDLLTIHGGGPPIFWFYSPTMYDFARHVDAAAVVYDCMDELANFRFAPARLTLCEQALMARADAVFTGGDSLYQAKKNRHDNIHAFPSSVDGAHFMAGRCKLDQPEDQADIPGPRLGYYGVIDERIDLDLVASVARQRPDLSFVFIGPVVKISEQDLPRAHNIHYLGQKPYAQLPAYLSGWDVALMPFALNDATRFISPTKTPEYLAAGRPVVSTPIQDVVTTYGKVEGVFIAHGVDAFVAACNAALQLSRTGKAWLTAVDALLALMSWDTTFSNMSAIVARSVRTTAPQFLEASPDRPLTERSH